MGHRVFSLVRVFEIMEFTWGTGDRRVLRVIPRYLVDWTEGMVDVPILIVRLRVSASILRVKVALPRKTMASHLQGLSRSFQDWRNLLRVWIEVLMRFWADCILREEV